MLPLRSRCKLPIIFYLTKQFEIAQRGWSKMNKQFSIPPEFHEHLLPGLPVDLIYGAYASAPGGEIESGKFGSPESSAALAANTFGLFLESPAGMPTLPGCDDLDWPALSLQLEGIARFPWSGGRHPCLDALIRTRSALIGVESKRYEPFRPRKAEKLSDAYWRPVWGSQMRGYEAIRDGLRDGSLKFARLDAVQLVKHAFGLRTMALRLSTDTKVRPVLVYLFAEPPAWPGEHQKRITSEDRKQHREEIARFAAFVAGDEVAFRSISYERLLDSWLRSPRDRVTAHARAIHERFSVCAR